MATAATSRRRRCARSASTCTEPLDGLASRGPGPAIDARMAMTQLSDPQPACRGACQAMTVGSILGACGTSAPSKVGWMRIVGTRVLSGPNLYDESSGVVIGTELGTPPPAGQPFL